ncbi:helix-turn-helix domain-containing protein [Clostridium thermobutyricum]|uniref:Helix-turn-helix protein n=1 Tax=Clostridium thermobutyricum DSM 4928 TaxID=1121339 RepID=A0A1V4SW67_9CLOT|nr:helix-turn-helix transcriptional regulator [Clostridium thermobutyricum]OPX47847.1 helix-turn-helix protein [Clostridium thermobutyricum DSM 4928]
MLGLEYVCKQEELTYTELARELGVTRQAITNWIRGGRGIPDKQLDKLEVLFTVDREWFNKELDSNDIVTLQYILNENRKINRNWYLVDDGYVQAYRIEKLKFLEKLESQLDDLYEQRMFEDGVDLEDLNVEMYNIFNMINLLPIVAIRNKLKHETLNKVMMAVINSQDTKIEGMVDDKFVKMLTLAIELENDKENV